jgi:hypothetical protein
VSTTGHQGIVAGKRYGAHIRWSRIRTLWSLVAG